MAETIEQIDLELKIAEHAWGDLVRHLLERIGELEAKAGIKSGEAKPLMLSGASADPWAGSTSANIKASASAD